MTILTLPALPIARSRFGLASNTQLFRSPLTGQTQTLERPGARWTAEYVLPPMKRAQMAEWQGFLAKLRGGAGRFYGFDPDAKAPRGSALALPTGSRNEVRNGNATGVTGNKLPTFWVWGSANGITRDVLGSGTENGIAYVETRFSGTPTSTITSVSFEDTKIIPASAGETWASSLYYRLVGGSLTNIAGVFQRIEQAQTSGAVMNANSLQLTPLDSTWRRSLHSKTLTATTPDTAFVRHGVYLSLTAGQAIDVTLRIGQAQLERAAAATGYIPTTGLARSHDAGARVDGNGQSGTQLKTWNWQPNVSGLLKTGDYVAFDTVAGRSLHLVVADVSSDAEGRAVLQLEPPLRSSPADNAALILTAPSCIMALAEDSIVWDGDTAGTFRLSFAAEERY